MKALMLSSVLALGMIAAPAAQAQSRPQAGAPVEFVFEEAGIFPLVAAPGRITDIALEPGEALVATNPIAAGDTARWIIGDTSSGEGDQRRVHVLVKPTASNLSTNLVINTTRRTYFLDLRASSHGYLTQVRWRYRTVAPALVPAPAVVIEPAAPPPAVLNFGYSIKGRAPFAPERVYDDGARTFVVFGPTIAMADLPPLFLVGPDGKSVELVNVRIEGRSLVVDRLLDRAELRLGLGRRAQKVRIARGGEGGR